MELVRFDELRNPKFHFQPVLLESVLILGLFLGWNPLTPLPTPASSSPPPHAAAAVSEAVSGAQHLRKLSPWQQTVPAPNTFITRAGKKTAKLFLT